jgi:hypothetical protein
MKFMKTIKFKAFKLFIVLAAFSMAAFAQSGKKDVQTSPTPSVNATPVRENKTAPSDKPQEEFQFVLAGNLSRYLEELNKLGKLKYRVAKAFNYDSGNSQRFAAVLKFDAEGPFEYDLVMSPNRRFIESRLNAKARRGFSVTHILPLTGCGGDDDAEKDSVEFPAADFIFDLRKADVFLLEKYAGQSAQVREYKVFTGKLNVGKSPTKDLQTALDGAPAGFHPLKVLFNKSGMFDLSISVLLEKNLRDENTEKIEYKFFKDVNGFEKEINTNAQNGFQIVAGRRIGLYKLALLAKVPGDAVSYIMLDADKYQKEFDKKVAAGDLYKGMFNGDTTCDSDETVGGKLVFAKTGGGSPKYEYKFLRLSEKDLSSTDDPAANELKKHLREGYRVRDIFYGNGIVAILEK